MILVLSSMKLTPLLQQTNMLTDTFGNNASLFVAASIPVLEQLATATEPEATSHLPADLNTTNNILASVLSSLESSLEDESLDIVSTTAQQEVDFVVGGDYLTGESTCNATVSMH